MTLLWCTYGYLSTNFRYCSEVSTVAFKLVNAGGELFFTNSHQFYYKKGMCQDFLE